MYADPVLLVILQTTVDALCCLSRIALQEMKQNALDVKRASSKMIQQENVYQSPLALLETFWMMELGHSHAGSVTGEKGTLQLVPRSSMASLIRRRFVQKWMLNFKTMMIVSINILF